MELKDFIELGLAKSDAVQTFWNYYLIVVTAIVGVYASEKAVIIRRAKFTKVIIMVLFMLFSASNLIGLLRNWEVRKAISISAEKHHEYDERLHGSIVDLIEIDLGRKCVSIVFHLALDLIMVLFIWFGAEIRQELTSRSSSSKSGAP